MAFLYLFLSEKRKRPGSLCQYAGITSKSQCPSDVFHTFLIRHQRDHRMLRGRIQLDTVGVPVSQHMAGEFHDRHLHSQADPQIRDPVYPRIADRQDHPLGASVSKASRNQDAVHGVKGLIQIFFIQFLRIHPGKFYLGPAGNPSVLQRFHHAEISVVELGVFPHDRDIDFPLRIPHIAHHFLPVCKVRLSIFQPQGFQDHIRQLFPLHGKGRLVEIFHIQVLQYMAHGNVAEQSDLLTDFLCQRVFAPAHQHVRLNSHSLKFLHAGLGGLGLHLARGLQIRDQRHMDQGHMIRAHLMAELADRFQKRLALDISHGSSHFDNGDPLLVRRFSSVKSAFDLIGDMGDYLYRSPAEISVAFFLQNRPVDLSCSHIGVPVQAFINKPLVMSQVQICFRPVVGDKDFTVLNGIHCTRIDIDVGIEFLHSHLIAPRLEKPSQGRGGDPLSQAGYHASGDKNIFYCHKRFPPPCCVYFTPRGHPRNGIFN